MKRLEARPSVPPYIHLGVAGVAIPANAIRAGKGLRIIEHEWRRVSAQIATDERRLRELTKRSEERESDPNVKPEDPCEVFFTVTDAGQSQSMIDFFF